MGPPLSEKLFPVFRSGVITTSLEVGIFFIFTLTRKYTGGEKEILKMKKKNASHRF